MKSDNVIRSIKTKSWTRSDDDDGFGCSPEIFSINELDRLADKSIPKINFNLSDNEERRLRVST